MERTRSAPPSLRRAVLVPALLFLLGAGAPSHCAGSSEDFAFEPEGEEVLTALAVEARPFTVFAAGSLAAEGAGLAGGAALVAFDSRTHAERWRFRRDDPTREDAFDALGVAAGRVCAAGRAAPDPFADATLIVACVHAFTGELLWQKELPLSGSAFEAASLDLSRDALVVTASVSFRSGPLVVRNPLVLSFDPRSGGSGESVEDFLLEPDGGADLDPRSVAVEGSTIFVAGPLSGLASLPQQAALVAFDAESRSERWRFRRDDPDPSDFLAVDADRGRVCVSGWLVTGVGSLGFEKDLLVGCLRARSGRLLWERQLTLESSAERASVDLSSRTLGVRALRRSSLRGVRFEPVVLSFDARDGTGGGPPGFPWRLR